MLPLLRLIITLSILCIPLGCEDDESPSPARDTPEETPHRGAGPMGAPTDETSAPLAKTTTTSTPTTTTSTPTTTTSAPTTTTSAPTTTTSAPTTTTSAPTTTTSAPTTTNSTITPEIKLTHQEVPNSTPTSSSGDRDSGVPVSPLPPNPNDNILILPLEKEKEKLRSEVRANIYFSGILPFGFDDSRIATINRISNEFQVNVFKEMIKKVKSSRFITDYPDSNYNLVLKYVSDEISKKFFLDLFEKGYLLTFTEVMKYRSDLEKKKEFRNLVERIKKETILATNLDEFFKMLNIEKISSCLAKKRKTIFFDSVKNLTYFSGEKPKYCRILLVHRHDGFLIDKCSLDRRKFIDRKFAPPTQNVRSQCE